MKAVVFGYHEIGYVCLEELLNFGADVPCLFTHPDDPGESIWFRRPALLAQKHGIPIYTPETLNDPEWAELIRQARPDIIFSFYYRKMIPNEILDIPATGALNLHGSLLPQFRGRAPVNWVLVMGEKVTGLTLHFMVEKPDAGDIVAQREIEIAFDDTAYTLFMKLAGLARVLMREVLPELENGTFRRIPQTGPSSYFGGRKPEDGIIPWEKGALSIYNLVRAVTHPYPGAFTYMDGRKLFVWNSYPEDGKTGFPPGYVISEKPCIVQTGDGVLKILSAQPEGGDERDGEAVASTYRMQGKILGG